MAEEVKEVVEPKIRTLGEAFGGETPADTIPEPEVATQNTGTEPVVTPEGEVVEPTETTPEVTPEVEPEASTFFDTFNQKFSTEFKSEDEVSSLLEKSKTFAEKEKTWSEYEVERKTLQEKINGLEGKLNPRAYFSSDKAYIAEQLRIQRPDLNPTTLQEVVMADIKGMDNFDALVKNKQLTMPDLKAENIKAVLMKKFGIDEDTPVEEWDDLTKTEIAIEAKAVKDEFLKLQSSVELPTAKTQEQMDEEVRLAREAKVAEVTPYVDKFKNFDKFTREIKEGETFEFDVPSDYKDSLEGMFKGFFVEGNLPINEENLNTVVELRDALLLYRNFNKIHDVIESGALAKHKAATDALLNNTQPENTTVNVDTEDPRAGLPGRGVESSFL